MYAIGLNSAKPRRELTALLSGGKHSARRLKRAQILLAAAAGASDEAIAANVGVGESTVYRTKRRFVLGNLKAALSEEPRPGAMLATFVHGISLNIRNPVSVHSGIRLAPGGNKMTKWILAAVLAFAATGASAQYYGTGSNPNSRSVQGYTTRNGTYVQPYVATNPNSTQRDNYGASGNVNPYTGVAGTRHPRY
jgi:hypothetical protein